MEMIRDYNLTYEALKVSRDSVILLHAEKSLYADSTAFYKGKYLKELKRKRNWRLIAVTLGIKEAISFWLRSKNSPFVL